MTKCWGRDCVCLGAAPHPRTDSGRDTLGAGLSPALRSPDPINSLGFSHQHPGRPKRAFVGRSGVLLLSTINAKNGLMLVKLKVFK